ncbi:MAG: T9SS type A sorting domain-containing protein [Bacteroidota bacterium]
MRKFGSIFFVSIALYWSSGVLNGQTLNENFDYPAGTNLDGEGAWLENNTGDTIKVESGSLTYTGYASVTGNKARLNASGQSVINVFGAQLATSTYLSFLVNVNSTGTSTSVGKEFIQFWYDIGRSNTLFCRVLIKKDESGNLAFGVEMNALSSIEGYTGYSYSTGTTYLFVVKYEFNSLSGTDDLVKLWIFSDPTLPASEGEAGTPVATSEDPGTNTDAISLDGLEILSNLSDLYIDGIRVANSWSDAPLPVQLTNFAATSSRFGVDLQWSTATEINNYGFDIERRSVGSEDSWSTVGFVQGAGTSTSARDYSYTDSNVEPGRYAYRIKQIDMSGAFTYYSAAEVEVGLGPKELALEPNYPNPFNPSTNITFTVPVDGRAALKVYNMLGQEVAILFDEEAVAGRVYQKTFDASSLPTGVYVSRLEFGGQSVMRKMLFVK